MGVPWGLGTGELPSPIMALQNGSKIETCEFEILSFGVSRSHTFTMAGENFDCAVGGLIIIFGLKLRGRVAGVHTRSW